MKEGAKPRQRRLRRTREDILQRIREAARQLFADRGYGSTTTKEIARVADVSETLVFRYYRDKTTLFNEVVTEPFQELMNEFVQRHPDASMDGSVDADTRRFTRQVFELFEENAEMFRALLSGPQPSADEERPSLHGLAVFFDQAVEQVQRRYDAAGLAPPFELRIGVRLGFGMIASSVLLRASLFPDWTPDREAMIHALEHLVSQSLTGPPD